MPDKLTALSTLSRAQLDRCYFGCFFDLLIDLSRGSKARICTISHIRTRMLYLT